jgi:ribonuclease P protein component
VYQCGQRYGQALFQVTACHNALGFPRLGLAVAARAVGNAVARNRIRRLVREAFRHRQQDLPALDLVVAARPRARTASNADLRADLERLLLQIASAPAGLQRR